MRGILAIVFSAIAFNAHALEQRACDKPVRFSAAWFPEPEFDNTKSSSEVTSIGAAVKGKGTQLGHVEVIAKVAVVPQESCEGFMVQLEFVKPVLRIASELGPGTCSHARVLRHENTHVLIYREIARQFRALEYPWLYGAKAAPVLAFAQWQLARLMQAQERLDSPEEYAQNRTACGGEILRLVKVSALPESAPVN
jgi:hypothetical protein